MLIPADIDDNILTVVEVTINSFKFRNVWKWSQESSQIRGILFVEIDRIWTHQDIPNSGKSWRLLMQQRNSMVP